jgi:phosphatidylglycerophosphate synthase
METFAKDTDGFMAKHFDRKISGAISLQLLKTPITPNQVTIGVTILGVIAGMFLAQPGYGPKVLGAFLFLATSILDGCDGEIARAKKMMSRLGGWLDLWGDNVVHVAVFYGLGVGLYKDTGHTDYLRLGTMAAIGTLLSASIASWQTYKKNKSSFTSVVGDARAARGSAWKERLVGWSDALARRDFVYIVPLLALIGLLEWFLWACAIGVSLYTVVLLVLWAVTSA